MLTRGTKTAEESTGCTVYFVLQVLNEAPSLRYDKLMPQHSPALLLLPVFHKDPSVRAHHSTSEPAHERKFPTRGRQPSRRRYFGCCDFVTHMWHV